MSARALSLVLIRILALSFLFKGIVALSYFPFSIMWESGGNDHAFSFVQGGMIVIQLLVAAIIWQLSDWLSAKVAIPFSEKEISVNITVEQALTMTFIVLGVIFLVQGLTWLFQAIAMHYIHPHVDRSVVDGIIGNLLMVFIGLYLTLRAGGLARLLQKIREL